MPLPPRQLWFLRGVVALGTLVTAAGAWEFALSGALHSLLCGLLLLSVAIFARLTWPDLA